MSFEEKIELLKNTLEKTGLKITSNVWGLRIEDTEENRVYLIEKDVEPKNLEKIEYQKVV